jgi:hypothetical protein
VSVFHLAADPVRLTGERQLSEYCAQKGQRRA